MLSAMARMTPEAVKDAGSPDYRPISGYVRPLRPTAGLPAVLPYKPLQRIIE
jgi:hypothetical protein